MTEYAKIKATDATSQFKTGLASQAYQVTLAVKNPVKLGGLMKEAFDSAHKHSRHPEDHQVACKKGCALCCYLRVDTTMPEVMHLVEWIKKNLSKEQIKEIKKRALSKWNVTKGLPDEEVKNYRIACPLLFDNECISYEARPINCRGFYSVELSKCEEGFSSNHIINSFWAHPMAISKDLMHGHSIGLSERKKLSKEAVPLILLEEGLVKSL